MRQRVRLIFVLSNWNRYKADIKLLIAAAVSEREVNEGGSSLIGRKTHLSSKRKGLWSNEQGTVVMREWRK